MAHVLERYRELRELADAGQHRNEHGDEIADLVGDLAPWTVVVPPVLADALKLPGPWGKLRLRRAHGVALIVDAVWPSEGRDPIETDVRAWTPPCGEQAPLIGTWVRAPAGAWRTRTTELLHLAQQARGALGRAADVQIFVRDPGGPADMLAVLDPQTRFNPKPVCNSSTARVVDLSRALFDRVDGAMSDRTKLTAATAVFVGVGSLGGSIAVHLARSGVGHFHLFDPDLLEPENICRHAADLSGLYLPKVLAVRAAVHRRNPSAEVQCYPASPLRDGPPGAAAALQALLTRPSTLLVVTTADDQVERSLNELAILSGTPALYVSVLGEGEYGRVFRVVPQRTACYQCILDTQAEAPETHPFLQAEAGNATPHFAAYRKPGIAGVGIDVEQAAVVAARMALQTLGAPLGLDYPEAHGDHFLLSFRDGWIFDHPLQVARQRYPRRPGCPVCSDRRQGAACETATLEKELSEPGRIWEGVSDLGVGQRR